MDKNTPDRYVIGLTGTNASGKGCVGQYLQELGYHFSSLSDILREEVKKQGLEASRDNLIRTGVELRHMHGPGVLAQKTVRVMTEALKVVDSFRHPAEVNIFRKLPKFYLFTICAPVELRFKRAQNRGRNENALTLEDFIAKEKQESGSDPKAQQLEKTLAMGDFQIDNTGSIEDLRARVEEVMKEIQFPPFASEDARPAS